LTVSAGIPALLDGGGIAFERILHCIEGARRSISIRCFDWRDDGTGQELARTLMAAADRGVRVTILKDLIGATYEYFEGSRRSFFHQAPDARTRLGALGLMTAYCAWTPRASHPSPLADAMLEHPNIEVHKDQRRFDHAKIYVIDEEVLFIGGMGVGDDARFTNVDFMAEVRGSEHVARYHARVDGLAQFDPRLAIDFLVHTAAVHSRRDCPLLCDRLQLIRNARSSLAIEMAYLGDRRITDELVRAVSRGVELTLITAANANVIGDLNLATCDELLCRTGAPAHLRVVLHPRMVHSKVMVVDHTTVELGSANFTVLSHGLYDEADVHIQDAAFIRAVETALARHVAEGRAAGPRIRFNRAYAWLERAVIAHQSRPESP
jgi:cardiolipin synthase